MSHAHAENILFALELLQAIATLDPPQRATEEELEEAQAQYVLSFMHIFTH